MYCPECGNKCETIRDGDCPVYRCTFCFPYVNADTSYWLYWEGKYEIVHCSQMSADCGHRNVAGCDWEPCRALLVEPYQPCPRDENGDCRHARLKPDPDENTKVISIKFVGE